VSFFVVHKASFRLNPNTREWGLNRPLTCEPKKDTATGTPLQRTFRPPFFGVCSGNQRIKYDAIGASYIGLVRGGRRPWLLGLSIDTKIAGTSQVGASRAIRPSVSLAGVIVENGRSVRVKCKRVLVNRRVYREQQDESALCEKITWHTRRALENAHVWASSCSLL
jgi:hypothetical protein